MPNLKFLFTTKTHLQLICRYQMSNKSSKKKAAVVKIVEQPVDNSPISLDKQGNVKISVLAKPGAKQNQVTNISEDGVGIQIQAPPVEGEANTELVKYLSKVLGLRKSDVNLDKGSKSRQKVVLVSKDALTLEEVKERLQKEIANN